MLSFIPGRTMGDLPTGEQWGRDLLVSAGALLRRLHDASTALVGAPLRWRRPDHPPCEVICHNDVAPHNLVVRDGRLRGVIVVDMASPGSRLWDLAHLAHRLAPFAEDASDFDPTAHGSPSARVELLVEAYGGSWSRAAETGRREFLDHAAMYRRDARRLRGSQ